MPLLAATAGCATVAVFQPTSAEVSLTEAQSDLHAAADAYCEDTREKGLATGEASFGSITAIFTGKSGDDRAYWRRIGADTSAPVSVLTQIRADLGAAAEGLRSLDALAREMMTASAPSREDVTRFERALIHARQSRDSLSDALARVNEQSTREYPPASELAPLDRAIAGARRTADDLAAARSADDVATLSSARQAGF